MPAKPCPQLRNALSVCPEMYPVYDYNTLIMSVTFFSLKVTILLVYLSFL